MFEKSVYQNSKKSDNFSHKNDHYSKISKDTESSIRNFLGKTTNMPYAKFHLSNLKIVEGDRFQNTKMFILRKTTLKFNFHECLLTYIHLKQQKKNMKSHQIEPKTL